MRRITLAALTLAALTTLTAAPAAADPIRDCATIGTFGTLFANAFLHDMESDIAGRSYRINRRKTLVIHGVDTVTFAGCRVDATLDVTLRRRIRRDAHGTMKVHATVTSVDLQHRDGVEICIADPRLDRVRLSNTLRLGEAVYRWVANIALPDRYCAIL